jgi:hypothetical protein
MWEGYVKETGRDLTRHSQILEHKAVSAARNIST